MATIVLILKPVEFQFQIVLKNEKVTIKKHTKSLSHEQENVLFD